MSTFSWFGQLRRFLTCILPFLFPPCMALAVAWTTTVERGSRLQTPWHPTAVGVLRMHLMAPARARPLWAWEQHGRQVRVCWVGVPGCQLQGLFASVFRCLLTASLGVPGDAAAAPLDGSVRTGAGRRRRHGTHPNHSCKRKSASPWAWASCEHICVHRGHFVVHHEKQQLGEIVKTQIPRILVFHSGLLLGSQGMTDVHCTQQPQWWLRKQRRARLQLCMLPEFQCGWSPHTRAERDHAGSSQYLNNRSVERLLWLVNSQGKMQSFSKLNTRRVLI